MTRWDPCASTQLDALQRTVTVFINVYLFRPRRPDASLTVKKEAEGTVGTMSSKKLTPKDKGHRPEIKARGRGLPGPWVRRPRKGGSFPREAGWMPGRRGGRLWTKADAVRHRRLVLGKSPRGWRICLSTRPCTPFLRLPTRLPPLAAALPLAPDSSPTSPPPSEPQPCPLHLPGGPCP